MAEENSQQCSSAQKRRLPSATRPANRASSLDQRADSGGDADHAVDRHAICRAELFERQGRLLTGFISAAGTMETI
jgi:hypothetical protein